MSDPKTTGPSADDWADTWFHEARRCRLLLREATELIYRFHVTDNGTGLHDAAASFLARMNQKGRP